MKDIAILNLTRFGDLVQTSPIVIGLRKRHPAAKIHLIVKRRFRAVAEMLPDVDAIHELDGDALARIVSQPDMGFVERFRKVREMVDRLAEIHFDVVYNFTHSRASAVLLSLLDTERTTGFTLDRNGQRRVDNKWLRHIATLVRARRLSRFNLVDLYLGAAGLCGSRVPVSVHVPEPARTFAAEQLPGPGPRVAIQLGASTDTKTWSVGRFAETLNHLTQRIPSARIVLVGVAAEVEQARKLRDACPGVWFEDLVGKTSIDELAAVLERAQLLLTSDTGTMHLAAAVGTTTCSVFVGLGTPYETAVYAEDHWALMSRISCAPCGYSIKCGHTVCHEDIPPQWLAEFVQRLLEHKPVDDLSSLPRADLLRTHFDENGLLELVPLHPREPEPQDLLALAYRAAFLESIEGVAVQLEPIWQRAQIRFGIQPEEWRKALPSSLPGQLQRMDEIARHAEDIVSRLEDLGDQPAELREGSKSLRETDEAIYAIARSEPLLAPLGLAHESELEDLPDADLPTLAWMSRCVYGSLRRRVAVLRHLIEADRSLPLVQEGGST
ncbi:MAG: glycosyltransferase family 9 protein [Deltaproteobacteria bacterium]|nr:glycosyltransferase family 9 protein [Deltaproteobacteria bacterium]